MIAPRMELPRISLRPVFRALLVLFTLTGFTGLLIEQCFEKLITTLLGASTPAAAIVLSVYFLGLSAGAFVYPRVRGRRWIPLRIYAFLEAGISLWALVLALVHAHLVVLLTPLLAWAVPHPWLLLLMRFAVACLWILPPTLLMGATFPALVDGLEACRFPSPRRMMALFYSLNVLGAIVGAFAGPFLLFPSLGITSTLLFSGAIDLGVAGTMIRLAQSRPYLRKAAAAPGASRAAPSFAWRGARILLVIGFLSGLLFFALEVVWTHLIAAVLGNSVYAFAAMLFFVLLGLWIGGALATAVFKENRPISPFASSLLLVVGGALLALQKGQWDRIPNRLIAWGGGITSFYAGEALRWSQAALLLLPPGIVLGMVYPTLFRMSAFPVQRRSELASRLSGANSIGCVLGALLCGFVLIPRLGSEATLTLLGVTSLALGLSLSLAYGGRRGKVATVFLVGAAAALWLSVGRWDRLALTSGGHVYFRAGQVGPGTRLLSFHEDTLGGITTVVGLPRPERKSMVKILLTNGKFQANDAGETLAQIGYALIPILHVRQRDQALVIGLGSGQSAAVVKRFGFRNITIAEIAPGIVQAAREHFVHINDAVLSSPSTRLVLEDGRNLLLLDATTYDFITMEISSIWFAGASSLYSREFYRLCQKRLRPGGVFQQWIQVHHIGIAELGSALMSLRSVFPQVSFWVFGGQGILVASDQPQKLRPESLEDYARLNPRRASSDESRNMQLLQLLASRLLAPEEMSRLQATGAFVVNTDSNRYLEYHTPFYNLDPAPFVKNNMRLLARFTRFPSHAIEGAWPSWFRPYADRLAPPSFLEALQLP
jgi:spermidine synthase